MPTMTAPTPAPTMPLLPTVDGPTTPAAAVAAAAPPTAAAAAAAPMPVSWAARLAASLPPAATVPPGPPADEDADDVDALPLHWMSQSVAVGLAVARGASSDDDAYDDDDDDYADGRYSGDEEERGYMMLALPSASLSRGARRAKTGPGSTKPPSAAASAVPSSTSDASAAVKLSRRESKHTPPGAPASSFSAAHGGSGSAAATDDSSMEEAGAGPKLTTEGVFNRIRFDTDHFMEGQWSIGYTDRFLGVVEVPFSAFLRIRDDLVEGIPTHRIVYFLHVPTATRLTRAAKYAELRAWVARPAAESAPKGPMLALVVA